MRARRVCTRVAGRGSGGHGGGNSDGMGGGCGGGNSGGMGGGGNSGGMGGGGDDRCRNAGAKPWLNSFESALSRKWNGSTVLVVCSGSVLISFASPGYALRCKRFACCARTARPTVCERTGRSGAPAVPAACAWGPPRLRSTAGRWGETRVCVCAGGHGPLSQMAASKCVPREGPPRRDSARILPGQNRMLLPGGGRDRASEPWR